MRNLLIRLGMLGKIDNAVAAQAWWLIRLAASGAPIALLTQSARKRLEPTDVVPFLLGGSDYQPDKLILTPFDFIDADVKYLCEGRVVFSPNRTNLDLCKRIVRQVGEIFCRYCHCFCRNIARYSDSEL